MFTNQSKPSDSKYKLYVLKQCDDILRTTKCRNKTNSDQRRHGHPFNSANMSSGSGQAETTVTGLRKDLISRSNFYCTGITQQRLLQQFTALFHPHQVWWPWPSERPLSSVDKHATQYQSCASVSYYSVRQHSEGKGVLKICPQQLSSAT